eukprot:5206331-Pyramimonas_sp.AAC.2
MARSCRRTSEAARLQPRRYLATSLPHSSSIDRSDQARYLSNVSKPANTTHAAPRVATRMIASSHFCRRPHPNSHSLSLLGFLGGGSNSSEVNWLVKVSTDSFRHPYPMSECASGCVRSTDSGYKQRTMEATGVCRLGYLQGSPDGGPA